MKTRELSVSRVFEPRYRQDVIQTITQLLEDFEKTTGDVVWDTLELSIERVGIEDVSFTGTESVFTTMSQVTATVIAIVEGDA